MLVVLDWRVPHMLSCGRRDDDMLDLPDLSTMALSKDTASAVLQVLRMDFRLGRLRGTGT
eukprot:4845682-Amphidinium_carterae.1